MSTATIAAVRTASAGPAASVVPTAPAPSPAPTTATTKPTIRERLSALRAACATRFAALRAACTWRRIGLAVGGLVALVVVLVGGAVMLSDAPAESVVAEARAAFRPLASADDGVSAASTRLRDGVDSGIDALAQKLGF